MFTALRFVSLIFSIYPDLHHFLGSTRFDPYDLHFYSNCFSMYIKYNFRLRVLRLLTLPWLRLSTLNHETVILWVGQKLFTALRFVSFYFFLYTQICTIFQGLPDLTCMIYTLPSFCNYILFSILDESMRTNACFSFETFNQIISLI